MNSRDFTRRKFASRFASLLSVFGVGAVLSPSPALAESSAAEDTSKIRKLNGEGKPGEKEIIEDLMVAAHADARRKAEALLANKMKGLTGGLALPPGLKLF